MDYKNIIFLDIDGVINILSLKNDYDDYGQLFHKPFVENLRYIIECSDADIVISSSWKIKGLSLLKNMWMDRNLPGKIIDITPNANPDFKKVVLVNGVYKNCEDIGRGDEVDLWLSKNEVERYVIIDDIDQFMEHQQKYFVKTSGNNHTDSIKGVGLTKMCAEKVIDLFNIF